MVCATAIAVNPDQRAVPDELPSPPAKRERLALLEHVTAVEAKARDAADSELERQYLPGPATGEVAWRAKNRADGAVREGLRVEVGSCFGVLLESQADRVFGHGRGPSSGGRTLRVIKRVN